MPPGFDNWGNYATIGITDHTCTTGLEYTFNNRYATAARPLTNESAIYFTTGYGTHAGIVADHNNEPQWMELFAAYPNPFNPETKIEFTLTQNTQVELTIYDVTGRKVKTLVEETLPAGRHSYVWSGEDYRGQQSASGVYLYRLSTPQTTDVRKMIMLK